MNFPVWDLPIAGGFLIAIVAVVHVFVSHFAIGGGLFLVWTEYRAYKQNRLDIINYLKTLSKFFILLTLVFGALTGVGIWFTIGLVNPQGTSALIRVFVWAWAIEWVFFFVEISAAFLYFYGWDRLDRATHQLIGWIYFVAAWMSLFVINGIITFMLTPGAWLETRSFWDGLFNPTFLPSLVLRTSVALTLAGLWGLLVATTIKDLNLKEWATKYCAKWIVIFLIPAPFITYWYFNWMPEKVYELTTGGIPTATIATLGMTVLVAIIFIIAVVGPLLNAKRTGPVVALLMLGLGLLAMGAGETIREMVRKPYVIYGYMYSNGMTPDMLSKMPDGVLKEAKWVEHKKVTKENLVEAGRDVFRVNCQSCHNPTGYHGLKSFTHTWDISHANEMLKRLNYLKGNMIEFQGSDKEREALAAWLISLQTEKPKEIEVIKGKELKAGKESFRRYCGQCHTLKDYNGVLDLVAGMDEPSLEEFIQTMERDYMPPFPGTELELQVLANYLATVGAEK